MLNTGAGDSASEEAKAIIRSWTESLLLERATEYVAWIGAGRT